MKLDENGYNLICGFEGLRLKPYLCSANIPTIGYGNTYYPSGKKVNMTDAPITKEYAFEIFKDIADRFAGKVDLLVTKELNQNQFNALVSFAYNVGTGNFASSTLLKKVNLNPNDLSIKREFAKWNKANKKVIDGLTNRRKKESNLYFK
jgi:lysozyme